VVEYPSKKGVLRRREDLGMNPEIKKEWVNALLSGEFEQTTQVLKDEFGYCCLGVLCEVYKKLTGKGNWVKLEGGQMQFNDGSEYWRTNVLPPKVRSWAEVDANPAINFEDENFGSLAELNDKGVSFTTIADVIEKQL
jgi:hypothetical protein